MAAAAAGMFFPAARAQVPPAAAGREPPAAPAGRRSEDLPPRLPSPDDAPGPPAPSPHPAGRSDSDEQLRRLPAPNAAPPAAPAPEAAPAGDPPPSPAARRPLLRAFTFPVRRPAPPAPAAPAAGWGGGASLLGRRTEALGAAARRLVAGASESSSGSFSESAAGREAPGPLHGPDPAIDARP